MSLESPIKVLYNSEGFELAVSQSQAIVPGSQPGILAMGSGSNGAQFIKLDTDGTVFVTGSLNTIPSGIQQITGSVHFDNSSLTVHQGNSGSIGQSWFVQLTDGAQTIGDSVSSPIFVTGAVKIPGTPTSVVTSALATTVSYTILPANSNRRVATFYKEGSNICYLKLGTGASNTSFTVKLSNNSYYEVPEVYTGPIDVIFNNATPGNMLLATEISG